MSPDETKTAAPIRDLEEPRTGDITVPIWLILVFALLVYWSQLYLSNHAGGFNEHVYAPFDSIEEVDKSNPKSEGQEMLIIGKDVYGKTCTACHQPNGMGKEGIAPPLVGSEWVQAPGPARITHAVLNGLTGPITVMGKDYNLTMPPWRDIYDDKHIAAVLTYIRDPSFGNKASPVKPEQVAAARKDVHPGPMTAPELLNIPIQ
jgi:mono/diheme cytochrome c family protein